MHFYWEVKNGAAIGNANPLSNYLMNLCVCVCARVRAPMIACFRADFALLSY